MPQEPTPATTDDLALYVYAGCGYCEDVRVAIRDLGLTIEERDIYRDPQNMQALVAARGRRTVPVLRIGESTWLPESQDIIAYLYERFGDGETKPPRRLRRWLPFMMWGLLVAGGLASEPFQSWLWASACGVAAFKSFTTAWSSKQWTHWAIGGAFTTGAASMALHALGVAEIPWWYGAFAVAAATLGAALLRGFRPAAARS